MGLEFNDNGDAAKKTKKCGEIYFDEDDYSVDITCLFCDDLFKEFRRFCVHIKKIHLKKDERSVKVQGGDQSNLIDENLEQGKNIPNIKIENVKIDLLDTKKLNSSLEEKPFECLRKELGSFKKEKNEICTLSHNAAIEELQNDEFSDDYTCFKCKKRFSSRKSLKRHESTVNCVNKLLNSFECNRCGKKFATKRCLKRHDMWTKRCYNPNENINQKKFLRCKYCDKSILPNKSLLEDHERTHTGEKPFQCQSCGKQFRTKAICTAHEKLHTTERLYKCEICNQTFKTKDNLNSHNLRHGEKKISCNYCYKLFFTSAERIEHERTHTGEKPFKCNYCGKCFTTAGSLGTHRKKHFNIRPHKCQYCDRSFYTKAMLKNHIVIHTGERPFICLICNSTFARKKGLKSHEKIHSKA